MMGNENLLPKNIRQIGEIQGRQKICLEDYVMTYIRKMENRGNGNYLGILLGERKSTDDAEYVFVRGIMEVPDFSQTREVSAGEHSMKENPVDDTQTEMDGKESDDKEQEHLGLWQAFQRRYGMREDLQGLHPDHGVKEKSTDKLKKESQDCSADKVKSELKGGSAEKAERKSKDDLVNKTNGDTKRKTENEGVKEDQVSEWKREQERRFPGWEIQGCCVIGTYPSGRLEELSAAFPEAARMLYHLQDQEERLYWQEGEQYEGIPGYFVFYEQNQKMQEYLSELFGSGSVEKEGGSDSAIISFREKVKSKAEEKSQSFLRLASSFFVVGVLIVGVIVVNRVSDMREAQEVGGTALVSDADIIGDSSEISDADVSSSEAADTGGNLDAAGASGEASDAAGLSEGTTEEAVSASGESALAGSDAFWADDGEDTAAASASDAAVTSAETVESGSDAADETEKAASADTSAETVTEVSADEEESVTETTEAVSRQIQAAYVIREGDTLAGICARYYGSLDRMEELCEANGIEDADLILPGQKIVLP